MRAVRRLGTLNRPLHLLMDRAYEGNETRQLALELGFILSSRHCALYRP
jgi:hypothetical protein